MIETNAISDFDGRTISYSYENGWTFTNTFDGHDRRSIVPRGELHEHVEMVRLREGLYFASWIDDEWGLLAQVIDFTTGTVLAAVPMDGAPKTEILVGRLTDPTLGGGVGVPHAEDQPATNRHEELP